MSASKYTWKIYSTHLVAISILVIMMISLLLIFVDNMWYQVAISFVMLAFYWIFMAMSLEKSAFSDARADTFHIKK